MSTKRFSGIVSIKTLSNTMYHFASETQVQREHERVNPSRAFRPGWGSGLGLEKSTFLSYKSLYGPGLGSSDRMCSYQRVIQQGKCRCVEFAVL
ncbi:hypothetical protein JXQ70_20395 [bacterium]|nr:hypothetical protein [bacterium]